MKFNCFFLMPMIDTFPTKLREELEAAYDKNLEDVFDVASVRTPLGVVLCARAAAICSLALSYILLIGHRTAVSGVVANTALRLNMIEFVLVVALWAETRACAVCEPWSLDDSYLVTIHLPHCRCSVHSCRRARR